MNICIPNQDHLVLRQNRAEQLSAAKRSRVDLSDFIPHETLHFGLILNNTCQGCAFTVQRRFRHICLPAYHMFFFSFLCVSSCKRNFHNTVSGIQLQMKVRFKKHAVFVCDSFIKQIRCNQHDGNHSSSGDKNLPYFYTE